MNNKKSYQLIIFDLDGTLVDSREGIVEALHHALTHYDIPASYTILNQMIGPPLLFGFSQFFPEVYSNPDLCEKVVKRYRAYYAKHCANRCDPYVGIPTLLAELKSNSKMLMVATSKPTPNAKELLHQLHLLDLFDYVAGSTPATLAETKDNIIREALLAAPPAYQQSAVMIGDRSYDIEGAKANGVDSVGVLYGYGSREELEACQPTYLMEKVDDLKAIL